MEWFVQYIDRDDIKKEFLEEMLKEEQDEDMIE
jgi:hypothetical protein